MKKTVVSVAVLIAMVNPVLAQTSVTVCQDPRTGAMVTVPFGNMCPLGWVTR